MSSFVDLGNTLWDLWDFLVHETPGDFFFFSEERVATSHALIPNTGSRKNQGRAKRGLKILVHIYIYIYI